MLDGGATFVDRNVGAEADAGTRVSGNMTLVQALASGPKAHWIRSIAGSYGGDLRTLGQSVPRGMVGDLPASTPTTAGLTSGNSAFFEVDPTGMTKGENRSGFPAPARPSTTSTSRPSAPP